jgi:hypothetical protein
MTNAEQVLTVYTSTQNGSDLTADFTQIADGSGVLGAGSRFKNDGKTVLIVRAAVTPRTMTLVGQRRDNFGVLTNTTVVCPVGVNVVGPFSTQHYNDSNGYAHITWGDTSSGSVLVAVRKGVVRE